MAKKHEILKMLQPIAAKYGKSFCKYPYPDNEEMRNVKIDRKLFTKDAHRETIIECRKIGCYNMKKKVATAVMLKMFIESHADWKIDKKS